jgi:hypothetical protein
MGRFYPDDVEVLRRQEYATARVRSATRRGGAAPLRAIAGSRAKAICVISRCGSVVCSGCGADFMMKDRKSAIFHSYDYEYQQGDERCELAC